MFIFFCIVGKDARDSWYQLLCKRRREKISLPTSGQSNSGTGTKRYRRSSASTSNTGRTISTGVRSGSSTLNKRPISVLQTTSEAPSDSEASIADIVEINPGFDEGHDSQGQELRSLYTLYEENNEANTEVGITRDTEQETSLQEEHSETEQPTPKSGTSKLATPGSDSDSLSSSLSQAESGIILDDTNESGLGEDTPSPLHKQAHNILSPPTNVPMAAHLGAGNSSTTLDGASVVGNIDDNMSFLISRSSTFRGRNEVETAELTFGGVSDDEEDSDSEVMANLNVSRL